MDGWKERDGDGGWVDDFDMPPASIALFLEEQ